MGISCGAVLIKYILLLFNLLWLILGGVVIWLGVSITKWSGSLNEMVDINMKTGSITILVAGAAIFVIAFLGCCGACKENSCMLSTYGGVILILVIIQCVGVYFAFKNKTDIEKEIKDKVNEYIIKFDKESSAKKQMWQAIQEVQYSFECCGTDGYESYKKTEIPASCCGKSDFGDDFQKTCHKSDGKYKDGCGDAVKEKLNKYLGGLGGVGIGLILVQLLIILSACCLAREVRN